MRVWRNTSAVSSFADCALATLTLTLFRRAEEERLGHDGVLRILLCAEIHIIGRKLFGGGEVEDFFIAGIDIGINIPAGINCAID